MSRKLLGLVIGLIFFFSLTSPAWAAEACPTQPEEASHPELPYPNQDPPGIDCAIIGERRPDECSANPLRAVKEIPVSVNQENLTPDQRQMQCEVYVDTEGTQLPLLDITREEDRALFDSASLKWEYILPWLVGVQKREPVISEAEKCDDLEGEARVTCLMENFKQQEERAGVLQKLTPESELDELRKDMVSRAQGSAGAKERIHDYVVCYYSGSEDNPQFVPEDYAPEVKIAAKELKLTDFSGHFPPENKCQDFIHDPEDYASCLENYQDKYNAWQKSVYGQCWSAIPLVSKERLETDLELSQVPGSAADVAYVRVLLPHIQGSFEAASWIQNLLTSKDKVAGATITENPTGVTMCQAELSSWNPGDFITGYNSETITESGDHLKLKYQITQSSNPVYDPHYSGERETKTVYPCSGCSECGDEDKWNCLYDPGAESCYCVEQIPTEDVAMSAYANVSLRTSGLFDSFADKFLNANNGILKALFFPEGAEFPEELANIPGRGTLGYRCENDGNYYADGGNEETLKQNAGYIYYRWLGTIQELRQVLIKNRLPYDYQSGWETTLDKNIAGAWYPPYIPSSSGETPPTLPGGRWPGVSEEHRKYLEQECSLVADLETKLCNPANFDLCWLDFSPSFDQDLFIRACHSVTDLCGDTWSGFTELRDWRTANCGSTPPSTTPSPAPATSECTTSDDCPGFTSFPPALAVECNLAETSCRSYILCIEQTCQTIYRKPRPSE